MRLKATEEMTGLEPHRLSRWRLTSPLTQLMILCVVVFLVPGMNSAILGLGAGGSHPWNIPIVDKANLVGACTTILAGILGGSVNNKIGPKYTLVIAASSYPFWSGSIWYLDKGSGSSFAYVAAVYHGIGAGLLYSTSGFIISSYSTEEDRGRYIATFWAFNALGSAASAVVVLGITANRSTKLTHVPPAVYITIVTVQVVGVLLAALLVKPSTIKRCDGRPIAVFRSVGWVEELRMLAKNISTLKILLLAPAFIACNMPISISGSLNGFYYNARTRALVNLNFWLSAMIGWAIMAFVCDSKRLGFRHQRSLVAGTVTGIVLVACWSALIWFLSTHDLDRHKKAAGVDWKDGAKFSHLFIIYTFFGCSWSLFQGYISWVYSTFSNDPSKLSHYSGFVEGMRATGLAAAFGVDSRSIPFLTEAVAYFPVIVVGLLLCAFSASRYTLDSTYGSEEGVIVPEGIDALENTSVGANDEDFGVSKSPASRADLLE